jgi:hypothetical protein
MSNNKVIEENIIEYYSDFHALDTLREQYEGDTLRGDYDSRLCREIQSIVYDDLIAQSKTELIHYILDDVCNIIDWTYITQNLQDVYFAEPSHD